MTDNKYNIPEVIVDKKEEYELAKITEAYNKMIKPNAVDKAIDKISENIPESVKDFVGDIKGKATENEIFIKSMEYLGKGFNVLEEYASKVTLSESQILQQINEAVPYNQITSLDEICLLRSYEIRNVVNKNKFVDVIAALVEGAATGAPGFVGIPFNVVLSTFLFYRAVQSIALFYGYDIKNDPAELEIASEVFMNALNPKDNSEIEASSGLVAKIMLLSTATAVKQTVKKGWTAMASKGGVHLLLVQMRALANASAKKALEKAGKKGLEKAVFSEVFEQIGKKLTQKAIHRAIPVFGAVVGAIIDTAQMIQIIKYADMFYCKRFILEKEARIDILTSETSEANIIPDLSEVAFL